MERPACIMIIQLLRTSDLTTLSRLNMMFSLAVAGLPFSIMPGCRGMLKLSLLKCSVCQRSKFFL